MAHRIEVEGFTTLEDLVAPGLQVLFVGYNPSVLAVEQGHYYARKANRFWEDLHAAGFVPRVLRGPDEDREILRYGLGLTDLVKRPSPNADALRPEEYRAGAARLDALLVAFRPLVVCFNGLGLLPRYRRWGHPPEGIALCAVPSTSPRNNGLRAARLRAFQELRDRVRALEATRS